ncbi:MAG: tautomerase family protein [Firmicutes bacterium]|nr:tautomerase family protein [Bacillota bacterium]
MPLVRAEIFAGKSKEYKKKLLDSIHSALVESFKIPEDDRIQWIMIYTLTSAMLLSGV